MKKSLISRLTSGFVAAFIMAILCSFCAIPAAAIEVDTLADTMVISAEDDTYSMQMLAPSGNTVQIVPLANNQNNNNNNNQNAGNGALTGNVDDSYESVVNTFIMWIRRAGALVAFVGGIMFALAIKNNDAEQKQSGIITMIAGFVVVAICTAANIFHLFD